MIRENTCEMVIELEADHTPHLSRAPGLVDAMLQFAGRVPAV